MKKYTNGLLVVEAEQFDGEKSDYAKLGVTRWTPETQPRDASWGYIETRNNLKHHVRSGDWIVVYLDGKRAVIPDEHFAHGKGCFVPLHKEKS